MINEHGSGRVFEVLAGQFATAGLLDVVDQVRGFAAEERHHGVLCGAVVEALGGCARARIDVHAEVPLHEDAATPLEALLRNVLSICCLSETVAVALIGAERQEMPPGELRDLLTRIWADEIGHARLGWRTLCRVAASLGDDTRKRLGDYLRLAFSHLVDHELAHLPTSSRPPPAGAAFGLCDGADARRLFFATVEQVIVPALQARGLPAASAWAVWISTARSRARFFGGTAGP
jgi:hypothetical protein